MDKKELIFPGTILGIVLIAAIGLIMTQKGEPAPLSSSPETATTTATSTKPVISGQGTSSTSHQGSGTPSGPTSYYPYGKVTLALNQAAGFKDGLSIRPLAITGDSRCPIDVQCIQAGTVRLSLRTSVDGQSTTRSIGLGETLVIHGNSVTLASVEPARTKDGTISPSAYRFTFVVEPVRSH